MELEAELSYERGRTTPTPQRRVPSQSTTATDAEVLSLSFVCRRKSRSILNCTVVGRDGYTPYFHIMTCVDVDPERTLFRTNEGRTIAAVEWGNKGSAAYVQIHNAVSKQRVSEWLSLSDDVSCRMMYAYGKKFVWAPQRISICMYEWDPSAVGDIPDLLARIEKEDRAVTLKMTMEAVNRGLLEMAVVATLVFQSGCRIN
ncbi:hypothetical protein MVEN_02320600 [Mycena venus]|uniref:Uncharacterized protein n=1 Tax=Mycena venus TaxID=2733690 RepID=A0A8H6X4T6_9AGAR|nr:hypothetical protein MVEN_02320600 [Mycena venus]